VLATYWRRSVTEPTTAPVFEIPSLWDQPVALPAVECEAAGAVLTIENWSDRPHRAGSPWALMVRLRPCRCGFALPAGQSGACLIDRRPVWPPDTGQTAGLGNPAPRRIDAKLNRRKPVASKLWDERHRNATDRDGQLVRALPLHRPARHTEGLTNATPMDPRRRPPRWICPAPETTTERSLKHFKDMTASGSDADHQAAANTWAGRAEYLARRKGSRARSSLARAQCRIHLLRTARRRTASYDRRCPLPPPPTVPPE